MTAFAAGFGALAVQRHRSFESGRFDLGNMVQAVWSTAHGHPLRVTDLHGRQISRLGSHFDVLLAAFAPLWRVWPSPELLLTVQAAVLALGALPVFWLARRSLRSERAAAAFAVGYLLLPPVGWLSLDDFHAVALAPTFLLFAFWYLSEDRLAPFAVFAALAAATREEVGLVVAALGVLYAAQPGRRAAGAAIAVLGVLVSVVAIAVVIPHFAPSGSSDFSARYAAVGGSAGGIAKTAVTNPGRLLSVAFDRRGIDYLAALLLPLGGLWLAAPAALLAAAPPLALNLLSRTVTQTSIHFHYTAAAIPGVVAAAVAGAGRIARREVVSADLLALVFVACSLAGNYRLGPIPLWRNAPGGAGHEVHVAHVTAHDRLAARAIATVPARAAVSTTNTLGAHLSARRRILSFPVVNGAGWLAVDRTKPSYLDRARAPAEFERALAALRRSGRWRLVTELDGVLVLRRAR
jgi:uncharacterized membrane protein